LKRGGVGRMEEQEIKAEVVKITGIDKDSPFIWVQIRFEDMKSSPGKYCEVTVPLKREDMRELNLDDIKKQGLTEATFFLARTLSVSYD
jgi:NAD(P)H-flavin reductase